jgi:hypothetical protein
MSSLCFFNKQNEAVILVDATQSHTQNGGTASLSRAQTPGAKSAGLLYLWALSMEIDSRHLSGVW